MPEALISRIDWNDASAKIFDLGNTVPSISEQIHLIWKFRISDSSIKLGDVDKLRTRLGCLITLTNLDLKNIVKWITDSKSYREYKKYDFQLEILRNSVPLFVCYMQVDINLKRISLINHEVKNNKQYKLFVITIISKLFVYLDIIILTNSS